MALTTLAFSSYDQDRGVVLFTVMNDATAVNCAITSEAMDRLDPAPRAKPDQREAQFRRLQNLVEVRLNEKFDAQGLAGNPPGMILRSLDFPLSAQTPVR